MGEADVIEGIGVGEEGALQSGDRRGGGGLRQEVDKAVGEGSATEWRVDPVVCSRLSDVTELGQRNGPLVDPEHLSRHRSGM